MNTHAEQIIGLYRRHATAWIEQRGTALPERRWLDKFLKHQPGCPSVLDLGCGAGTPVARYLLEQGCGVTGIDSAPELIATARSAMPQACWHVADMRGLWLQRTFDGILAWNSSFHLTPDDQRAIFATYETHASAGAVLMFTSGPAHGEAIGNFQGEALYHASLDAQEYRSLLNQHGFDVLDHKVEDPDCGGLTIWLAQRRD